jgi:hypothetical protein
MGSMSYTLIRELELEKNGAIVEIGSERGEGSTKFISDFCREKGYDFFTVDWENGAYERAKSICGDCAYKEKGEVFLSSDEWISKDKKITFAYLDNFDWCWYHSSQNWYEKYKLQVDLYASNGITMNNENSGLIHLEQTKLVHKNSDNSCYILYDDTFHNGEMWDGKGGKSVEWLLKNNFEIFDHYDFSNPDFTHPDEAGWVLMKKINIC